MPQLGCVQANENEPGVLATNDTVRCCPLLMKKLVFVKYCSRKNPCCTSVDVMSSVTVSPWFTTNGDGETVNANVCAEIVNAFVAAAPTAAETAGTGTISAMSRC